jgi:hypothetical protein
MSLLSSFVLFCSFFFGSRRIEENKSMQQESVASELLQKNL